MWNAEIIDKRFEKGTLFVDIEFTDGVSSFVENYERTQIEDPNWIENTVRARIADLESLGSFEKTVSLGAVSIDIEVLADN